MNTHSTLIRRPEPPPPRAATPEPRITITGTLLEDAYASTEAATGRVAIAITIAQAAGRPAIIATQWCGDGPDNALHAHERARGLRAGDIVTVHADGICNRYVRGDLVLSLIGARGIELVSAREERRA